MKKIFSPNLFTARVYQSGSSTAKPFEIGVEGGQIILTDLEGNPVDELQGDDWNLTLGGTNDDKVILKHGDLGHTIVTDTAFLSVLAEGTNYPHITDQAKKLKRGSFGRTLGRSSGMIALGIALLLFVGFVIIGLTYRGHESEQNQQDTVTEREGHTAEVVDENDGQKYVKLIQPIIKEHWSPPHSSESFATVFKFAVSRSGHISDVEVAQSSGSEEFDALGLAAIKKVSKLPPLPASLTAPTEVEFTFSENVHRGKHRRQQPHH